MFRFTIRDVLWLTVVAALAVAWWTERTRLNDRISVLNRSDARIQSLKQSLGFDENALDDFINELKPRPSPPTVVIPIKPRSQDTKAKSPFMPAPQQPMRSRGEV